VQGSKIKKEETKMKEYFKEYFTEFNTEGYTEMQLDQMNDMANREIAELDENDELYQEYVQRIEEKILKMFE